MKKIFTLAALSFIFCKYSSAQIICILCYSENDSISTGVNNLLSNGGFESGCVNGSFCPNSVYYTCDIPGWTCTGGGSNTYVQVFDSNGAWYGSFLSEIIEGQKAAYLGNFFATGCSYNGNDTSCIISAGCTILDLPPGYPNNTPSYGGTTGVSISQTVTGLVAGNTYVLEFWAGGEYDDVNPGTGVFAVDVGFGDTLLRCHRTDTGDVGTRYIIEFNATSPDHTIKFTNWGHICSNCTEVVLDNVRLYTLAEYNPSVPACSGSPAPNSFATSDTDICEKFCINFFDSSQNNPTSWLWQFPGGDPSSSTNQNPTNICYNAPGMYDVTLITTNSSGTDTLTLYNYITVYPTPPFPTITQVGYTLTSSPANSYQWQLNATDISSATNQSYNVVQSGLYTVIVNDSNGCVNSSNMYVLITGIAEVSDATIFITPNPSNGKFTIELLNLESGSEVSIHLVNALGQNIFSSAEIILSHDWEKEVDLSNAPEGVYFIEIKSQSVFLRKKIIVAK